MSNAITLFGAGAIVPAHIANAFADNANVLARETTPSLTFRGKSWRLKLDGEETLLTRMNADGDSEPTPIVKMVVLDVNPKRSRTFYAGAYVEGENKSPDCWSTDGDRPDADVPAPCAQTCAACPNAAKGSKITANQKETTACATLKRLVVVPAAKLDMTPLLLKVPQTSMWDKNNAEAEAKGFFAWDQYVDFLRSRGVVHTAAVVTKIKFDPNTAYPKLLFTAERFLDEEEARRVVPLVGSEAVKHLLTGKVAHAAPADESAPASESSGVAPAAPKPPAVTKPPKPAAVTKPPKPAAVTPPPSDDDDDGGFGATPAAPAAPVKPAKAAPPAAPVVPPTTANADLAALAAAWDD